jgi:hypothetical protein
VSVSLSTVHGPVSIGTSFGFPVSLVSSETRCVSVGQSRLRAPRLHTPFPVNTRTQPSLRDNLQRFDRRSGTPRRRRRQSPLARAETPQYDSATVVTGDLSRRRTPPHLSHISTTETTTTTETTCPGTVSPVPPETWCVIVSSGAHRSHRSPRSVGSFPPTYLHPFSFSPSDSVSSPLLCSSPINPQRFHRKRGVSSTPVRYRPILLIFQHFIGNVVSREVALRLLVTAALTLIRP